MVTTERSVKLTYEDYCATPDDKRYELLNGDLMIHHRRKSSHQRHPALRTPGQPARLQALAELAGLAGVSSHSGRRGLASELVRHAASTTAIQQAAGWRSPQMVARYASAVARYFGGW